MDYNFDLIIDRNNTNCSKWDSVESDVLPMWVADMDFKAPNAVINRIKKRAEHGIFGYVKIPDGYYKAEMNWWQNRHNFSIKKEWIEFCTGVIPSLSAIIQAFTKPGDKVMIQSPVYNYFNTCIINNGCDIVLNELIYNGEKYEIDFNDFESKIKSENVSIFILCNPHNPVGRVWSKAELTKLGEICLNNNVLVISDEIHRDLVFKDYEYVPFASISEEFLYNSITCTAPSKTFNLAGLKTANMIIANPGMKKKVNRSINDNEVGEANIFGVEALISAYEEGAGWLDNLMIYLESNKDYAIQFIKKNIPSIHVIPSEGTYLLWIDCRKLKYSSEQLNNKLMDGKLRLSPGSQYGLSGEGFLRMNIACPRNNLEIGLNRLSYIINNL